MRRPAIIRGSECRFPRCAWLAACALLEAVGAAGAQGIPMVESPDPVPFTLPPVVGVSSTIVGDRSALQVLVRPSLDLRSWETESWGLRVRLGLQFSTGFHGLDDIDPSSFKLVSVVPGIEGVVPIGQRSVLRPFVELGVSQLAEDRRGPVFGTGIKSESVFPAGNFELGLEPNVAYRTALAEQDADATTGDFTLYGDARHPLWFRMGDSQPDVGVYLQQTWLWSTLEFETDDEELVRIRDIFEIGAIFGFQQRPRVWFFRLPTIGIGYRFGELRGVTIRIGGDRLIRLWDPPRDRSGSS